jgi:excisionase family DNA binding protein
MLNEPSETNAMPKTKPPEIRGLYGLSERADRFLKRHPDRARQAIIAALEALAADDVSEDRAPERDIPERLKPFVVEREYDSSILGVTEAARRLEMSRTTVYEWVRKHVLLGWTATRRGLHIPSEQILGPGKVVGGIAEVLDIIEEPKLAWIFLSEERPFSEDVCRPIDKLKSGEIDEVVRAAPGFGTDFT